MLLTQQLAPGIAAYDAVRRQTGSPLNRFTAPGGTAAKDTVHRAAVAAVAVEQGLYGPDVAAGAASAQHRQ